MWDMERSGQWLVVQVISQSLHTPGVWIAQEQVTPAGSQVTQEVQIQADPLSATEKLCVCEISRLNLHYSVCVHACKLSAEL